MILQTVRGVSMLILYCSTSISQLWIMLGSKNQQLPVCSSVIYKRNVSISLRLSDPVQCRRGYYFRALHYISALEHIRMLILSINVLPACINTIYKYGHAWVI